MTQTEVAFGVAAVFAGFWLTGMGASDYRKFAIGIAGAAIGLVGVGYSFGRSDDAIAQAIWLVVAAASAASANLYFFLGYQRANSVLNKQRATDAEKRHVPKSGDKQVDDEPL